MTVTSMPQAQADAAATEEPKKGKKKLIIIIAAVLLLIGGGAGAYFFFLAPGDGKPPPPVAGKVVALEPIQINLKDAHYLRLGLALQLTDKATEADGSKALDAAIELFSGRDMAEIANKEKRTKLKEELLTELTELYEGEVMDVYFTDFVTQ